MFVPCTECVSQSTLGQGRSGPGFQGAIVFAVRAHRGRGVAGRTACTAGPLFLPSADNAATNTYRDAESSESDWSDEGAEEGDSDADGNPTATASAPTVSFPELEAEIKGHIATLGGGVFAKLNWSAPRDASWLLPNGSLCCRCA